MIGVERHEGRRLIAVKAFHAAGLSTVDDIETPFGKLALVALLADPLLTGSYGSKKTAKAAAAADRPAASDGGRWMSR